MANRNVRSTIKEPSAIQMYDYKSKVFKDKKAVPSLGRQYQSAGRNEDAPTSITAVDVEKCRPGGGGGAKTAADHSSSLPWYRCAPMGIDHPCFKLGLLITATVTVFLLYLLVRVFIK